MRKKWYHGLVLLIIVIGAAGVLLIIDKKNIDAKTRSMLGETSPKLFKEGYWNLQDLLLERSRTAARQSGSAPLGALSRSSTESANLSSNEKQSETVTLFMSGGELGYLKPCGCSEGQVGGISRRDTLLTRFREQGVSVIPIATGNLILDASRQSEIKADIGFFALTDMGYIAYNVGQHDLQLGITYLTSLSEQNKLPLLSANLYRGPSRVFLPYILHTVDLLAGEITIVVIGLISPKHAIYAQNLDLKIVDPQEVIKPLMPKLRETADVIVCLFNGATSEATALQSSFPMLDIVVVSNAKTSVAESSSLSTDQFVNTETKGKSIWSVPINRDITGTVVVEKAQRHLLDGKIPDSTRITQLLELYQEMVEAENVAELTPREQQNTGPQFVGTAACKTCHINEWESWKKTKHAHAYHTLEVAGHETDPECLTCHTVGFGVSSGFISVGKTPNHVDVGCENCHGAGSTHAEHPEQKGYGTIKKTFCVTCHTTENSPKFDIEVYFPKVVHSSNKSSVEKTQ